MAFKSILKPDGSVMASIATIAAVYGIYQLNIGSTAGARASADNHPALEGARKRAGWSSIVLVSALTLVTKDANIGVLGGGTIIAMELSYRWSIMQHPESGELMNPTPNAYQPAENVVPFNLQGQTG